MYFRLFGKETKEQQEDRDNSFLLKLYNNENKIGYISGACAGFVDTIVNFIPYGLHYRLQRNQDIHPLRNPSIYTPRELYRGVFAYGWIIPVTCIADGFSTYLMKKHQFSQFTSTILSGMLAAITVSSVTSNIIITQQELKLSTRAAIRHIINTYGYYRFTTAMSTLLIREAIYSNSVFYGNPKMKERDEFKKYPLLATAIVGIIATIISQPFDTVSTFMIKHHQRLNPFQAAIQMFKGSDNGGSGFRRFYKGVFFRGYAVFAGIFVMSTVSEYVKKVLTHKNNLAMDKKNQQLIELHSSSSSASPPSTLSLLLSSDKEDMKKE